MFAAKTASGRSAALVLMLLLLVAWAPTSAAHEDFTVVDGIVDIPAGESVTLPTRLHYHRALGTVQVLDAPGTEVTLRIHGLEGVPPVEGGRGNAFKVNALVPCCKGEEWTVHLVEIHNPTSDPVQASVRLSLVHDNLAVLADDAEPGAVVTAVVVLAGASVAAAVVLKRGPARSGGAFPWAVASTFVYVGLWLATGAMGLAGWRRYGGGLAAGMTAFTADLPRMGGEFVNTQSLILMAMMLAWAIALVLWAVAARRANSDRREVARLSWLLGGGALVACGAWGADQGVILVPAILAISTATLPLIVGWELGPFRTDVSVQKKSRPE